MPVETSKGFAYAYFIIDLGMDHNNQWFCCINTGPFTGQFWTIDNTEVRACSNISFGRGKSDPVRD